MNPRPGQSGRKRKPAPIIPQSDGRLPECPEGLLPEACAEWRRLEPRFRELGFCDADTALLAGYCQSYANWRAAEADLQKRKARIYKTKTGFIREMPEVSISQRERGLMNLYAQQLGLTPASRKKIGQEPQGNDQEAAEMRALFGEDRPRSRPPRR